MNKFSMKTLSSAALMATLAFAAHGQVGVSTGPNAHIDNDVRARAMANAGGNTSATPDTRAGASTDGRATRAVKRTGKHVEGAMDRAADATKRGAYRAKDAVGNTAERANRSIQKHLPQSGAGNADMNVQGSGNAAGQLAKPPQ